MTGSSRRVKTTRRQFLKTLGAASSLAASAQLFAACSAPTPAPAPQAPPAQPAAAQPTNASAAAPTQAPAPAAGAKPADVARNKSFILSCNGTDGKFPDWDIWNPVAAGGAHNTGLNLVYEPLAYYSALADKTIMYLAESFQFSPDYTQLTIKTRQGVKWSDGEPFTAEDVAWSLNMYKQYGAKVRFGVDVGQYLDSATATDANTVLVKFVVPAPRFFFYASYKFDIGLYIFPKHIFANQDMTAFKSFDLAKGWPVTTGPWKVVYSSPEQKIFDRRDDWWGVKAGVAPHLPSMQRIVWLPYLGETQVAQAIITDQIDSSTDLRPATIKTVLAQNQKVITHTFRDPPYGNIDWWPTSLYLNCSKAPYDDPDVRWAVSYFINRQQVIDVGYGGAATTYPLPMPNYPGLDIYTQACKDLLAKYDTLKYDPQKGNDILTAKGWKKGSDGIWVDNKGNRQKFDVLGWQWMSDIGPVVVEQLRKAGFDAQYIMPPDAMDRFYKSDYVACVYGHNGSVKDPYDTLRLYQSATVNVKLAWTGNVNLSKWTNRDYDAIVDDVYMTPMEDTAKLKDLFHKAMEIWLPALPDIQIVQWYHRIPMDTLYWKNYPTRDNPYCGAAYWALTAGYVFNNIESV